MKRELQLTLRPTNADVSAAQLVADARLFDRVVVSGGDGTVTQVINGMVGSDVPLAIIPGGTGNVLAQAIGVTPDLRQSCDDALKPCDYLPVDLGLLNEKDYFALRLSMGYEALVTLDTTRELKTRFGKFAYMWQAAQHALRLSPVKYRIDVDGTAIRTPAESVWVANTSTLGVLGLELDPAISLCDRQLDLCIFRFTFGREIQRVLRWLLRREQLPATVVKRIPVKEYVNIAASPRQPVQIDGDSIGNTPCRIRVIPGGVLICKNPRQ
jgi:diacylglycerol kinase family enzyme